MSKLRFEIIDSKLIDSYLIQDVSDVDDEEWLSKELFLKDTTNNLIKKAVAEYENNYNTKIDASTTIVRDETITGLVVLKHGNTDTIVIIKMPSLDHDGNTFFFNSDIYEDKITDENILDILCGVIKYKTKPTFYDRYIELEPSNTCWIECEGNCLNNEPYTELEKFITMIRETSFLDALINKYAGKIVYAEVDSCGGILNIHGLDNLDNLDHVDTSFCV